MKETKLMRVSHVRSIFYGVRILYNFFSWIIASISIHVVVRGV
jgi:hypothetical protein